MHPAQLWMLASSVLVGLWWSLDIREMKFGYGVLGVITSPLIGLAAYLVIRAVSFCMNLGRQKSPPSATQP